MDSESLRPEQDQQFSEVLVACLEAVDNKAPEAVQQLIALHPEYAAELARFLEGQQQVDRLAGPLRDLQAELPAPAVVCPEEPLGDYRLVREVGRGGMGVVYEAVQLSLGRRVALKVLPFAATLDARQLQRFKNEAQAAAGLQHPHIVPVHAVGCERGVHYYAMQFIDGMTLAALIAELRRTSRSKESAQAEPTGSYTPSTGDETAALAALSTEHSARSLAFFRTVAELGRQAAEALEHAHQLGVIHRDIKPGNLLLENAAPLSPPGREVGGEGCLSPLSPPGRGVGGEGVRLWITDFGLAHCQSQASLTMTGDLVGTLRYMSPEQALARRVGVDHRTDVYSLGATLYELLTLEPVFAGRDRQELLRQIAFEEPCPLRKINKEIPAELETIVLKAMEKNPAERYATAQELADDLERWLKDEPIRARRPTVVQRLRCWSRRHRPVVAALTAGLVTLLLVGVALAFGYQRRLAETDRAVSAALTQAETLLAEGDKQIEHPERWQATAHLALASLQKAEELLATGAATAALAGQVEQVRASVETAVANSRLRVELNRIRLEQAALKEGHSAKTQAGPWYAKVLGDYGVDLAAPEAAAERVRSSALRETLLVALEEWAWATEDEHERQRLVQLIRVAEPEPNAFRARWRAAVVQREGKALVRLAVEAQVQGLAAAEVVRLGRDLVNLNEPAAAEQLLRAGQERNPSDFWLAHNLGILLYHQGPRRAENAVRYLTTALALCNSAGVQSNLGLALLSMGDVEGAIRRYEAALQLDPKCRAAHLNLGVALKAKGRLDDAIQEYQKAIDLDPKWASAHNNLGTALSARGQLGDAIQSYRKAIELDPKYAVAHRNLGNAFYDNGQLDEAIAEYRRAINLQSNYPDSHNDLGLALKAKGNVDQAITAYRVAIRLRADFPQAHYNLGNALAIKGQLDEAIAAYKVAVHLKSDFPDAYNVLGNVLAARGRLDEAVTALQTAIRLKKDFPEPYCNLGNSLLRQGHFNQAVEQLRLGQKLGSRNPRWAHKSTVAQWIRNGERLMELDVKLAKVLKGELTSANAGERAQLGWLCQQPYKQLNAAASRLYAEAFAAEPSLAVELRARHRYHAACAAILAGCGQGKDADKLDDEERARLRQQALDWLRADLTLWRKQGESNQARARSVVRQTMQHWLADTDLAGVRDPAALARLSEPERQRWQALWSQVAETLAQAEGKASPDRKK
jgi:serine/threonine protein kinase/Tfp pilus assembly protein PilF